MRKRTTAKSQAAAPGRGPRRSRLVDALFAGAEPREALVARALLDQQDAEHKLREAKAHKADAEGHSPRARVQTVEEAEAAWVAMRKEAIGELRIANNLLSEASASLDSAQQLKTQTEDILQQAGGHTASVRTEVNALQATAIAEARQQADADRQEFVRKATADIAVERRQIEADFTRVLADIDEMQQAVQAELAAQRSLTNAIRINAIADLD